jgi:hypothetical protein
MSTAGSLARRIQSFRSGWFLGPGLVVAIIAAPVTRNRVTIMSQYPTGSSDASST